MLHVWDSGEKHKGFPCGNLNERDHLESLEVDGRIILNWILKVIMTGLEHDFSSPEKK